MPLAVLGGTHLRALMPLVVLGGTHLRALMPLVVLGGTHLRALMPPVSLGASINPLRLVELCCWSKHGRPGGEGGGQLLTVQHANVEPNHGKGAASMFAVHFNAVLYRIEVGPRPWAAKYGR
eukprot:359704-Chlamydomonas_euryale.AAC.4